MEETTSRTLVVIMVATLFIALFGSVATLNKFGGFKALTGAWSANSTTTYGAVNLTISQNLVINFSDDTANFGTGYICSGACTRTTIGTDMTNDSCNCGWSIPNGLILENTGNRLASLKISNTNYTSSLLYDTAGASGYAWKFENLSTSATCGAGNFTAGVAPWGAYTNITSVYDAANNWTLCSVFNYTTGNDKINISFKLYLTTTTVARTGLSDTWTVSAYDAGQ